MSLSHSLKLVEILLARRLRLLAELAAVVGVVALDGAQRIRLDLVERGRRILGKRQSRVFELLQPLGRHLAAEGAGGDRPLPDRVAAIVELHAAGLRRLGRAPPGRRRPTGARAAALALPMGFGVLLAHATFLGVAQPKSTAERLRKSCTSSHLQVILGAQQRQSGFSVVPFALARPCRSLRRSASTASSNSSSASGVGAPTSSSRARYRWITSVKIPGAGMYKPEGSPTAAPSRRFPR